jgi:hypothetical protein
MKNMKLKLPHTLLTLLLTFAAHITYGQGRSPSLTIDPNSRMYSQLLQFEYEMSARDPFVSPLVPSTLVIDDEFIDAQVAVDREKLRDIITQLQNYIKSRIKIQGISSGRLGSGFAIALIDDAETNQVIRPGQFLLLPSNSDADRAVIQTAAQMAADAGEAIEISTYEDSEASGILIPIRAIKDKTIELDTPLKSKNISEVGTITIPFQKSLINPKKTQTSTEK